MVARKQLHDTPHLHFLPTFVAGKEFLRFPFGENEARCFAVQYVNEMACNPYPTAKIRIISKLTMQKAKKMLYFCQYSFCQQLVMIPLVAEETILVALGIDNPGVVRLLFFIDTAADGHFLVAIRL